MSDYEEQEINTNNLPRTVSGKKLWLSRHFGELATTQADNGKWRSIVSGLSFIRDGSGKYPAGEYEAEGFGQSEAESIRDLFMRITSPLEDVTITRPNHDILRVNFDTGAIEWVRPETTSNAEPADAQP